MFGSIPLFPWWGVAATAVTLLAALALVGRFHWAKLMLLSVAVHVAAAGVCFTRQPAVAAGVERQEEPPVVRPPSKTLVRKTAPGATPGRSVEVSMPDLSAGAVAPATSAPTDSPTGPIVRRLDQPTPNATGTKPLPVQDARLTAAPVAVAGAAPRATFADRDPFIAPPNLHTAATTEVVTGGKRPSPTRPSLAAADVPLPKPGAIIPRFDGLGKKIVCVVDISGSMGGGKLLATLEDLIVVVTAAAADTEVGLICFNSHVIPLGGLAQLQPKSDKLLAELERLVKVNREFMALEDNRDFAAITQMRGTGQIVPGGGTKPQPALEAALDLKPDTVVLLTDGVIEPTDLDLDAIKAKAGTITIRAVEIGPAEQPSEQVKKDRLIYKLAVQHGGEANEPYRYVQVLKADAPPKK